ncbi:MAG: NIPSNAP family protein, partial [Stellaceae bacterium]
MIFEMRTYRLQPGSVPEVEKRFGEALTERVKVSPLGAFFHTEVGPLNHIIHIWPYDDLQHRTRVRSQSIPNWPPKIQEFEVEMESKIV